MCCIYIIPYIRGIAKMQSTYYHFFGDDFMIRYEPFYKTLKEKDLSTYKLIKDYGISRGLLDRLKHNKPISTVTLNDLCTILKCRVEDILVFTED